MPVSRSSIIQPSVRTSSDTQNGSRQSSSSIAFSAPLRHARDVERDGKGEHEGERRHEDRHDGRAREGAPVERLGEELEIVAETELHRPAARRAR